MSSEVHATEGKFQRHQVRQRAPQAAAVERRKAKAVTGDIARRLTEWHVQIARLRGLVDYGRTRGYAAGLDTEIEDLAVQIREHRTRFIEAVGTLPPSVASSSWITDIDRVLCRASDVIETLRAADRAPSP